MWYVCELCNAKAWGHDKYQDHLKDTHPKEYWLKQIERRRREVEVAERQLDLAKAMYARNS